MKNLFYILFISLFIFSCGEDDTSFHSKYIYKKNYDESGRLISEGNLHIKYPHDSGSIRGLWTTYYEDGSLYLRQHYFDDVKHGIYRRYVNGEVVEEGSYTRDVLTDCFFPDYQNGIFSTLDYKKKYPNGRPNYFCWDGTRIDDPYKNMDVD